MYVYVYLLVIYLTFAIAKLGYSYPKIFFKTTNSNRSILP